MTVKKDIIGCMNGKKLLSLIIMGSLLISALLGVFPNGAEGSFSEVDIQDIVSLGPKRKGGESEPKLEETTDSMDDRNPSKWFNETLAQDVNSIHSSIATDSFGHPHVCYEDDDQLIYTRWDGNSWTGPWQIDLSDGSYCSIDLNSDDQPFISYYDQGDLMLAYENDSGWQEHLVDDSGDVGYGTSIEMEEGPYSDDQIHISYLKKNQADDNYTVKYSHYDGLFFSTHTLDDDAVDDHTSLALDSGTPRIAFEGYWGDDVEINVWTREPDYDWNSDYVSGSWYYAESPSISGTSDGECYVAFQTAYYGLIVVQEDSIGEWDKMDHDGYTPEGNDGSSMVVDSAGYPNIAYDAAGYGIGYSRWDGTSWTHEKIEKDAYVNYPSISLDENDHPHLTYLYNNGFKYAVSGAPTSPQGLQAVAGNDYVKLYWSAPYDEGGRNVTDYKIYRGTSSGGESHVHTVDDSTTVYTDSGLSSYQKYFYYVTAVNDIGESQPSNEANATTSSGNNPPAQPSNILPEDGQYLIGDPSVGTLLGVEVHDPENDTMNVHFWGKAEYESGYNYIDNDTVDPSNGEESAWVSWSSLENNTKYEWWAVADDGANHTYSESWIFYSDDWYENNDNIGEAYDITDNETELLSSINGQGRPSDADWYDIYVNTNVKHVAANVTFDHAEGDLGLALYNSSGSLLASSDTWTDNETIHYLVNETSAHYYLKVYGQDAGNFYDLWWDDQSSPLPPKNPDPKLFEKIGTTDPTLSVDVYDGNEGTMDVRFYNASNNQLIGTDYNVPHNGTASVGWTGLNEGDLYDWYAVADDGTYTTRSDTWYFFVNSPPNIPTNPSPANGTIGVNPDADLSVDVSDPDGDSMDVVFYNYSGGYLDKIGTDKNVPDGGTASITWKGLAPGHTYNWFAKAVDGTNKQSSYLFDFTTDDRYEENDYMSSSYDISSDEQQWLSSINGSGIQADSDWYEIFISAAYEHLIARCTFSHSDGDIDLALYSSSGKLITSSYSTTDNESIDYYVSSGGTYYLRVYYGDMGNSYDLWWDDKAGTPNEPTGPSPSDGATITTTEPSLAVEVVDPDGDPMDVRFYNASSGNLIDTDTGVASGEVASVNWTGLTQGQTYLWYAVADDGVHTNQSGTWSFNVEGDAYVTHDIGLSSSVADGWNFVSCDLIPNGDNYPEAKDLTDILDDSEYGISGNYDKVMYFDTSSDSWKTYVPGRGAHYNDLSHWNRSMGIWIHMTTSDTLTIEGSTPDSTDIQLSPGWNMAGYPSQTFKTASETLPGEITKIGVFDSAEEYNIRYINDLSSYTMSDGEGYWIYNPTDHTVTWTVWY